MDLLYTLGGLVALVIGAEIMIRGAVEIALRARISPLVVGLTIVALGTSLPELLVSLLAAMKGSPALAIGNVVGSNIANISLVLGASILIFPIEVDRDARRIHWPVMMAVTLAFIGFMWDDRFERWEGLMFMVLLATYITTMVYRSRRQQAISGVLPENSAIPLWRSLLFLVGGVLLLGWGADLFVDGAVGLARTMGVSDQMIGLTIVAVGTSLPELITSLLAALRKQPDISLGNLIGSNIFNLLGIAGTTAAIHPIALDHVPFLLDLGAMTLLSLVLLPLMRFWDKLGRWQGALLLMGYIYYVHLVIGRG